ncbi:MAG: DUF881 domain-containing protein [Nocardioides sp.]|nr:DUF881 domain-containing protein [Nocardioides sp.]
MAEETKLPEHVTQPLLNRITADSLDGDYQHVADRRAATGEPAVQHSPRRTAALVAVLFGLMIIIAVVQTSRNAATTEEGRQALIRQITSARSDLRSEQERIGDLRAENADLIVTDSQLTATENGVIGKLLETRGVAGFAPVTGPGVRIKAGDSLDGSSDGRIRDEDLAVLVDGLWAAGAEAISINGQRLTSVTGIRSAASAILVNSRPLKPPYTVLAIGNPNTMQSLFAETSGGVEWMSLKSAFGFEFEMVNDDNLSLPASRRPQLRSVEIPSRSSMKEATP